MFEHRSEKLLPRREYLHRQARSLAVGLGLITVSLSVGMIGYHFLAKLPWIDAFLDSAMILSGMGPVSPLTNDAAKVFAGCYAIYCGVALISTAGIIMAPTVHRSLHKFHLEFGKDKDH
jgi:hypothetical protein